jgi:UDP-2-acetamido-3-amino-2,3-dideoxy-glucuronate N-acetyltransferase
VSQRLIASDRAPGLLVAPDIVVPEDAQIAPHVTIYSGVSLGAQVSLGQGAIVGRPQQVHARSSAARRLGRDVTSIGDGCHVGSYAVVTAGAQVGARSYLGDQSALRETAVVGEDAVVGRGAAVSPETRIGDRARLQNLVLVGPRTVIEEDVMVGPLVTFVGDPTMGRRRLGAPGNTGIVVRRASRIGTGAIIFPPVEIGEEAVVGAAALVRSDVRPQTVVTGSPATDLRAVREDELLEKWC